MKIVNTLGLPQELFNAVCANWYSGAREVRDYSVTELIQPTRVFYLQRRHDSDITVEAASMLWSMLGSAMHLILEKGSENKEQYLTENRFKTIIADKIISGGLDVFNVVERKISDYKYQSVWNYMYLEDHIEDLTKQLSFYKVLLNRNGIKVDSAQIIYLFRDYQRYMRKTMPTYPPQNWASINITFMEDVEKQLTEHITEKEKYKTVPDNELPLCTMKERWQKPNCWQFKRGNKKVKTIEDLGPESKREFDLYTEENPDCSYVYVTNYPKRCPIYCNGRNFCDYYVKEILPLVESGVIEAEL